ncbi:MAG TPA: AraC family transcriptional regulator [Bryobacteraceae bacterium]|nr:AraC family transcriptional regulator [Acidobacteriaceae bacterium]
MLDRAIYMRDSTDMVSDPFSEILKLTNAESVVTGGFSAQEPWAIAFPAKDKIKFFAVVRGNCWVELEGEAEPVLFEPGDVGLLVARRSYVLSSKPGIAPLDAMELFSRAGRTMAQLGNGEDFAHLGGHVLLDPVFGQLLMDVLPPWIHIGAASPHATTFRWLLEQLVKEQQNEFPGSQLASGQLAQLLFVQILRAHLETAERMPASWLRALADRRIAPALRLMHAEPGRAWSLDALATACALSRTTFAAHFKAVAAMPPLTYLTEWRMRLAQRALRDSDKSIADLAQSLGYGSESAFSNAFKRTVGLSPKNFRLTQGMPNQKPQTDQY